MGNPVESLAAGRRMKVFLVELDDDNRERVISGIVEFSSLDVESDTYECNFGQFKLKSWDIPNSAMMTLKVVPREDGSLFRIENFMEEVEDD